MRRLGFVWLVSMTLMGCSDPQAIRNEVEPQYEFLVRDVPDKARFELALRSLDPENLCLGVNQWPNNGGEVESGSQRMTLEIGTSNPIRGKDAPFSVSCPGGCGYLQIGPGETLTGFIGYDQFGSAADVHSSSEKTLKFPVHPIHCRPGFRVVKQLPDTR